MEIIQENILLIAVALVAIVIVFNLIKGFLKFVITAGIIVAALFLLGIL